MKCKYCQYEWKPKVKKPKSCPRCKTRFDFVRKFDSAIKNGDPILK